MLPLSFSFLTISQMSHPDFTSVGNVSENPLYLACVGQHPCGILLICALTLNIVALFGMFMNSAVIWVTIRNKYLHRAPNFLLALCAFFELLHQHGHLLFLAIVVSGHNMISYHLALRLCALSLFGIGGISLSMAFTGLDRLLCVLFPINSKRIRERPFYVIAIVLICSVSSAIFVLQFFIDEADLPPNLMILGTLGDLISGQPNRIYGYMSLTLNTFTVLIYVLVGLLFRFHIPVKTDQTDQISRRLFRSLFLIISVNIGGYFLLFLFAMIGLPLISGQLTHLQLDLTMFFLSTLLNLSSASSGPILYMTSTEYRRAFVCELLKLLDWFGTNPLVTTKTHPPTPKIHQRKPIKTISVVPMQSLNCSKN